MAVSLLLPLRGVLAIGGPAGTKFGGNGELSACFRARLGFRGETLNRTQAIPSVTSHQLH